MLFFGVSVLAIAQKPTLTGVDAGIKKAAQDQAAESKKADAARASTEKSIGQILSKQIRSDALAAQRSISAAQANQKAADAQELRLETIERELAQAERDKKAALDEERQLHGRMVDKLSEGFVLLLVALIGWGAKALWSLIADGRRHRENVRITKNLDEKLSKTQESVDILEKNTNSIKDALVKVTGEKEYSRGLKDGEASSK